MLGRSHIDAAYAAPALFVLLLLCLTPRFVNPVYINDA